MRLRIIAALVFAVASLGGLASPAQASSTPVPAASRAHHVVTAGLPACEDPANSCTGPRDFPPGAFMSTAKALFIFQSDGNLVVYDENNNPRWASNTDFGDFAGLTCTFQADGNLVIYNGRNQPVWASNTYNHWSDYLVVQGDGNVVIYDPGDVVLWATNTNH